MVFQDIEKIVMDKVIFDKMYVEDLMVLEKLVEGIVGFIKVLEVLEYLLEERLKVFDG